MDRLTWYLDISHFNFIRHINAPKDFAASPDGLLDVIVVGVAYSNKRVSNVFYIHGNLDGFVDDVDETKDIHGGLPIRVDELLDNQRIVPWEAPLGTGQWQMCISEIRPAFDVKLFLKQREVLAKKVAKASNRYRHGKIVHGMYSPDRRQLRFVFRHLYKLYRKVVYR